MALRLNSQISLLLKNCQRNTSFYSIFLLDSPFFKATKQKTKRRNPAIWMHSMMRQTKQQKVFLFLCLIFVLEGFSNSSKRVPYRDIKPIKKRSGGWIGSLWSGNSTSGSTLARLEPRQRQNICYSFCRKAFKWKNKDWHFLVCLKSENGFLCSWYVVFLSLFFLCFFWLSFPF